MEQMLNNVKEFHAHIGETIRDKATLLPSGTGEAAAFAADLHKLVAKYRVNKSPLSELVRRMCLNLEEIAEWSDAHANGDIVEATDALADRLYCLIGDAVSTGLPLQEAFEIVHKSNLTKSKGKSNPAGKGVKDDGFVPPQLTDLLDDPKNKKSE